MIEHTRGVECDHCGAEFDSLPASAVSCPHCGQVTRL